MFDPRETLANYYRSQGAEAVVQAIVRNIQSDAVMSTNLDVRVIERLVQIIEATQEDLSLRP